MRDHCRRWAASRQIQLHGALARSTRSTAPQGRSLLGQHRPHNPSAAGRALCRQPPRPSPHPTCHQASPCAALPPAGQPSAAPQALAWAAMTGPQQMTWRSTMARPLCHPARPPSPQSLPPPWYACPGLSMALTLRLLHLLFFLSCSLWSSFLAYLKLPLLCFSYAPSASWPMHTAQQSLQRPIGTSYGSLQIACCTRSIQRLGCSCVILFI